MSDTTVPTEPLEFQEVPEKKYFFFGKRSHKVGIALLLASFGLYAHFTNTLISDWNPDVLGILSLLLYAVSMAFGLIALFTKRDLYIKAIALTQMYVCCFAFNTQMHLFGSFSPLQTALMIGTQLCLLALHKLPVFPEIGQKLLLFCTGLSMVFTLHLIIHLIPAMPIATVGIIVFGLGILIFVPVFSFFHFIRMLRKAADAYTAHKQWFWSGIILPILAVAFYLWPYATFRSKLSTAISRYEQSDKRFSRALFIRQYVDFDQIDEVYLNTASNSRWNDLGFSSDTEHQPMYNYAQALVGSLGLSQQEKDLILNGLYEHRHENSPRLWSGNHLVTEQVATRIDVFPQHRLAYVEKIIDVKHSRPGSWPSQQEALYTFHLPDGAVGTSLSLWIDGKEEPARLSTSTKANTAYSTIVGRERRDPAIMNWKDGNRLSVNVFPIQSDLPRKFKVGFTVPLHYRNGHLSLQDIYFQGPDYSEGKGIVQVNFQTDETIEHPVLDGAIQEVKTGFQHHGGIQEYWQISWKAPPMSNEPFCFDGECYSLEEFKAGHKVFKPKKVLFDLNSLWSASLFNELTETFQHAEQYVYDDESKLILLTSENKRELFNRFGQRSFSVIPPKLFAINQQESSDFLVISKEGQDFPILSDLPSFSTLSGTSPNIFDRPQAPFFLFELSRRPHLNTQLLQNAGIAHTHYGLLDDLNNFILEEQFPVFESNEQAVLVRQNQTCIKKRSSETLNKGGGPDHLLRLFNYGLLMEELRGFYFKRDQVSEDQIALARSAYIVSPFSSLVSLENIGDYQRFEITEPKPDKSLLNAGSLGGGSVPEPHEWVLIVLAALSMSFLLYKRLF